MSNVTSKSDTVEIDESAATTSSSSETATVSYRDYSEVPWHRKSSSNTLLILLSFLTFGFVPGNPPRLPLFVLTGDIYYDRLDEDGNLAKWSWGNKIVAIILLVLNVFQLAAALGH